MVSFASSGFIVSSLRDLLGIPPTRIPLGVASLISHILPPVVGCLIMAVLAVTPQTRTVRVALWPVVASLAFRAASSVEMSFGKPDLKFLNIDLTLSMFVIMTRTLDWTLAEEPPVRHLRPANSAPSTIMDALELVASLRGHGWNWSRGLYTPRETRPTHRVAFVVSTCLSVVVHIWICGALHRTILLLAPAGAGSPIPGGSTIFDDTLPVAVRYLRSSLLCVSTTLAVYAILQLGYDACVVPAVLFLGQDPAQWPPPFEAPWCATSLGDFWGRRWHQWFRRTFLFLGGYPLSRILGRTGIVVGAFLSSAVFHQVALTTLSDQAEVWRMVVGFGMMAPGVLAERVFHQLTGRKVGGVVGWVWTMAWLLLWGHVIVEGFARAGMFGCSGFVDSLLPVQIPVEPWVIAFDRWLHTI